MRVEIAYVNPATDGRVAGLLDTARRGGFSSVEAAAITDVYVIDGIPELPLEVLSRVFSDSVVQVCSVEPQVDRLLPDWSSLVEIRYRPGVTDPVAMTAHEALEDATGAELPPGALIQTAVQYAFRFSSPIDTEGMSSLARLFHNPLVQQAEHLLRADWDSGRRFPQAYPHTVASSPPEVSSFPVATMSDGELAAFSRERLLALSLEEMRAVRDYFSDPSYRSERRRLGLPESATDVEIEMIAQTWSEHCKHKILNARITYVENGGSEEIDSLFATYIRRTTSDLASRRPFLKSVFHDNSGVIAFDDETLVCFKVETHNSPSALDPYGGAITGIVGVNRDILGTGKCARPIFNTDVLCFAHPATPAKEVPAGLLHPARVLSGVHRGIIDGGNQSGIPVVAGAFVFDESYMGKPLVFCGTGGMLPATVGGEEAWVKHIDPGDKAVMVGGRIGKDGIHGATFSSLALDETSPTSAVQIGDPITQKKMSDLLLEARDLGLFKGITDNGAGGLSSSLGEMAELSGGIRIDLSRCPLKYQGLAPWEILVSESQERMSLAVDPARVQALLDLAARRDVEATVVGEFTDSGWIDVFHGDSHVAHIDLSFLHDGLPVMHLAAEWNPPVREEVDLSHRVDFEADLLALLSEPSIASKETLLRQYDHEVLAQSVTKPFAGVKADAPSDGAVLRPRYDKTRGLTVTHGICQRFGDVDTYHMAMCAVDEAYRAHIALGGDPEYASALDNFCWPDPVESDTTPDGKYKLAQLVRACKGLRDACLAYSLPLISGKDSMKNDTNLDGRKVSVRPTLLVSLMGVIEDVRLSVNTDFIRPGDAIVVVGDTRGETGGTAFEKIAGAPLGRCPAVQPEPALARYRNLHRCITGRLVASCHDLADGGLGVALAESCFGGRVGAEIDLKLVPGIEEAMETTRALFCETPSRFVVSVSPEHLDQFVSIMGTDGIAVVGRVIEEAEIRISRGESNVMHTRLDRLLDAWKGTFR